MKYELQTRMRVDDGIDVQPPYDWETIERSTSLSRLRGDRKAAQLASPGCEFRIVEVVPDAVDPATPTIEEKHAAELEELAIAEKRWAKRSKLAATKLKKIRRRKRRLERLYAPSEEPA